MINEAVKLSNRAREIAKAKGYRDVADDFAQEAYLAFSRGRKAPINTLLIDFVRDTFGDNRAPNAMAHKLEYHSELPVVEAIDISPEIKLQWDSILNLLDFKDRVLVMLKFYWELEQKEIGYVMGISEGRVSQRLKEVLEGLKKKL